MHALHDLRDIVVLRVCARMRSGAQLGYVGSAGRVRLDRSVWCYHTRTPSLVPSGMWGGLGQCSGVLCVLGSSKGTENRVTSYEYE